MKSLLSVAIFVIMIPSSMVYAQERVTIDVTYIEGNFSSMFSYPQDLTIRSGKRYGAGGVQLGAKIRITDTVSAGYRFERVGLHAATSVTESVTPSDTKTDYEPDLSDAGGSVKYQEFFGSLKLPKSHGHSLVVGVAKSELARSWRWENSGDVMTSHQQSSLVGIVLGVEGRQKMEPFTFDYSGRIYPHMNETTDAGEIRSKIGFELRGTMAWLIAKHVSVVGGYQFRRTSTSSSLMGTNGQPWPINENRDNKALVVGTRISF